MLGTVKEVLSLVWEVKATFPTYLVFVRSYDTWLLLLGESIEGVGCMVRAIKVV